ncbi:MAG: histidine kinase [Actinomycetes bacterium]
MDESVALRLEIARELHDGIAQEVVALGYRLDEVIGHGDTSSTTRAELREIRTRITTISGNIRDEIFRLRGLDPRPFREVIESIGESIFKDEAVVVKVNLPFEIDERYRSTLIKIIQETLINTKSHSQATKVEISQTTNSISIRDNGGGRYNFDNDRWGASGLKERAALIGAEIQFASDTFGAKVTLTWNAEK